MKNRSFLNHLNNWFNDWVENDSNRRSIISRALVGTSYRASLVTLLFAFSFLAYSFSSLNFISRYDPNIQMWHNFWPRFLFNFIPLVGLASFITYSKFSFQVKVLTFSIMLPLIIQIASWIHVWPIMIRGNPEVYFYVHAANIYLMVFAFILVSPPNRYMLFMASCFLVLFWAPLGYLLKTTGKPHLLEFMINDLIFSLLGGMIGSSLIHSVRMKLNRTQRNKEDHAEKFLGSTIRRAIFENKGELLDERTVDCFLLAIDIRGYTTMVNQNEGAQTVSQFMEEYHKIVTRAVAQNGGVIHKTSGDGHLISFGAMDELDGLEDIPNIMDDRMNSEMRRMTSLAQSAVNTFAAIEKESLLLSLKMLGTDRFCLGAGVDFGKIEIKVMGDQQYRQELDIYGKVINRCVRLENHTKVLMGDIDSIGSMLIVSPYAYHYVRSKSDFGKIETIAHPVRDYPQIRWISYKFFDHQVLKTKIKKVV